MALHSLPVSTIRAFTTSPAVSPLEDDPCSVKRQQIVFSCIYFLRKSTRPSPPFLSWLDSWLDSLSSTTESVSHAHPFLFCLTTKVRLSSSLLDPETFRHFHGLMRRLPLSIACRRHRDRGPHAISTCPSPAAANAAFVIDPIRIRAPHPLLVTEMAAEDPSRGLFHAPIPDPCLLAHILEEDIRMNLALAPVSLRAWYWPFRPRY